MIYFLLAIQICSSEAYCRWVRVDTFVREDDCHDAGRSYRTDETVVGYKCVMQMTDETQK